MSDIQPIAGVSLEQYANLCAAMADTDGDESKELAIASEAGVSADSWREAKTGWTAKMQDPADAGKTAYAFMPLFQAAQARSRGGAEPCTIHVYATISTQYSYEKDDAGEQVPPAVIFARHGITAAQWNEYTSYWTPKVNDPADPSAQTFRTLVQAESDRIFGIVRDANGSVVDADEPETASPPPVPETTPPAAPAAPAPATNVPPPAPPQDTAPQAAPPPQAAPIAIAGNADAPDLVPGLTEEDKMWAAAVHASAIVGFGGWVPVIVWLIFREPDKSAFVRFHAGQAAIAHFAALALIIVVSFVTCGFGTVLILPWMAFEGWMAWVAYQGKRSGYPMVGDFTE